MTRFYSDPRREPDPHALPDIEIFWHDGKAEAGSVFMGDDGEPLEAGYYWWFCFPGCLPDSDPVGPFASEEEALAAVLRDGMED